MKPRYAPRSLYHGLPVLFLCSILATLFPSSIPYGPQMGGSWAPIGPHCSPFGNAACFFSLKFKAILHYVLGLRFGNVCEQNATKRQLTLVFAQRIV